jgi:hypothetical protein
MEKRVFDVGFLKPGFNFSLSGSSLHPMIGHSLNPMTGFELTA